MSPRTSPSPTDGRSSWINVVTDGLPALALVVDPPEADVLQRPPRHPDEPMLGRAQWRFIVTTGLLQDVATLGVFVWALNARDLTEARNLAFSPWCLASCSAPLPPEVPRRCSGR
jgi:Ca2+-transporting ATPase